MKTAKNHAERKYLPGMQKRNILTFICCVLMLSALVFVVSASSVNGVFRQAPAAADRPEAAQTLFLEPVETLTDIEEKDETQAEVLSVHPLQPAASEPASASEPVRELPTAAPIESAATQPAVTQETAAQRETPAEIPEPSTLLSSDAQTAQEEHVSSANTENASEASASVGMPELTAGLKTAAAKAPAAATAVAAQATGSYTGKLKSASDSVDYTFTVSERGVLRYSVSGLQGGDAQWKASLYQKYYINGVGGSTSLRQLNVLNAAAKDGKTEAPGIGLAPGEYVLRVSCGGTYSAAIYTLDLRFTAGTSFEIEYNDTVTRYTEIWPNVKVSGSAGLYDTGRDEDWYMLRIYSDCAIELQFTHTVSQLATVAFKVCLYDAQMNELYGGSALHSAASLSSGNIGLPEGTYFIQVQSRVYAAGEYTLTAHRVNLTYEKEGNDSMQTATLLSPGQKVRGALTLRSGKADRDYFALPAGGPGYGSVYIKNLTAPEESVGNIRRISLMDAAGRVIWSALVSDAAVTVTSPNVGMRGGEYYLLIDNDNLRQSDAPYEVGFNYTVTGGWEMEFNGDPAVANPVAENAAVSGTLTDNGAAFDEDWYTLTVQSGSALTLQFAHEMLYGKRDVFNVTLYNAGMQPQGSVLVSYENTETASGSFSVSPGTYYIKVTSGKYNTDARYNLTYSIAK